MVFLRRILVVFLGSLALVSVGAQAQDAYPQKQIKIVVPYPPGG